MDFEVTTEWNIISNSIYASYELLSRSHKPVLMTKECKFYEIVVEGWLLTKLVVMTSFSQT